MTTALVGLIALGCVAAVIAAASASPSSADIVLASWTPPDSRALAIRFVERSRRFRRNGVIVGLVLAAAFAAILRVERDTDGAVQLDLILIAIVGLSGSVAGSVLAEAFRLRRGRGPRTASLEVRDTASYADPVAEQRERWLLASAAAASVTGFAAQVAPVRAFGLGLVVALLAALRHWGTHRIAERGRPAMPVHLRAADDQVRRLAASGGFGRPITVLMALVGSLQWGASIPPDGSNGGESIVTLPAWLGAASLAIAAAMWWYQNRMLGLPVEPRPRLFGRGRDG